MAKEITMSVPLRCPICEGEGESNLGKPCKACKGKCFLWGTMTIPRDDDEDGDDFFRSVGILPPGSPTSQKPVLSKEE